jgi:hypothetical protein
MFKPIAIFACLASVVFAQTPVRECGNGLNSPLNVRFRDCVAEPCTVIRGEPSTTYIQFENRKFSGHFSAEKFFQVMFVFPQR